MNNYKYKTNQYRYAVMEIFVYMKSGLCSSWAVLKGISVLIMQVYTFLIQIGASDQNGSCSSLLT